MTTFTKEELLKFANLDLTNMPLTSMIKTDSWGAMPQHVDAYDFEWAVKLAPSLDNFYSLTDGNDMQYYCLNADQRKIKALEKRIAALEILCAAKSRF